ncbi:DUF397 domain-containing protein [Streptomyces griseosporeus]
MTEPAHWRKSTYSGGGDGDTCVEIAELPTHIAVRDSKAPARATLSFTTAAFSAFVGQLKAEPGGPRRT